MENIGLNLGLTESFGTTQKGPRYLLQHSLLPKVMHFLTVSTAVRELQQAVAEVCNSEGV